MATSPDYIPGSYTKAYLAVQYFQQNPELELSTKQLAELTSIDPKSVPALLKDAEQTNLLAKRKLGNGFVWSLGTRQIAELEILEDAAPADDAPGAAADDDFSFALWQDGELMVNGARTTDTGFVLNVQQTAKLVAYLTSTADYMEYLGAKQST